MTRQQVLDIYFMDARAKLIDLGAFIDRVERAAGDEDFRMKAFRQALTELGQGDTHKARRVLLAFSSRRNRKSAGVNDRSATPPLIARAL